MNPFAENFYFNVEKSDQQRICFYIPLLENPISRETKVIGLDFILVGSLNDSHLDFELREYFFSISEDQVKNMMTSSDFQRRSHHDVSFNEFILEMNEKHIQPALCQMDFSPVQEKMAKLSFNFVFNDLKEALKSGESDDLERPDEILQAISEHDKIRATSINYQYFNEQMPDKSFENGTTKEIDKSLKRKI